MHKVFVFFLRKENVDGARVEKPSSARILNRVVVEVDMMVVEVEVVVVEVVEVVVVVVVVEVVEVVVVVVVVCPPMHETESHPIFLCV